MLFKGTKCITMDFLYSNSLTLIDYWPSQTRLHKLCELYSYSVFDSLNISPFELLNLVMQYVLLSFFKLVWPF